ncbi:MAG TPA: phosphatase PAP2 family protein [Bacteroidota bacterium]|nr:phosphatase PAP2 family protein [Bacteroidota bacterium]
MTIKELSLGRISLKITDALILGALLIYSILALVFFWRVPDWQILILKNILIGCIYVACIYYSKNGKNKFWNFFIRIAVVSLAFAYLFGAVAPLQMLIHNCWLDDIVLKFENYVFGVQPTVWLQQFISKPLTEWLMFSYVIYIPLYPILCGIIYYSRGERAMEDYFFTLGYTNVLCDIGFILFPVASPMYHIKQMYTVPLDGWVWTYLGEFVRSHFHFAGGSIPSPHAAAATIMWVMAYRYHRTSFWILSPIILSLYISTFYCRYHYVTDAVVGILVAIFALYTAPSIMRWWNAIVDRSLNS